MHHSSASARIRQKCNRKRYLSTVAKKIKKHIIYSLKHTDYSFKHTEKKSDDAQPNLLIIADSAIVHRRKLKLK